ncbi:hypothetical protein NDA13_004025 [Ustilago tritici]|nr:hypothetical protein NDA13_004025 [Ustilago tritici]
MPDQQTHASDASAASTTRQIQADGAPTALTSDQEDTDNPAPVPLTEHHEDDGDKAMEDPYLIEPDQWAFQLIFTGRLVYSLTLEILDVPQANAPTATARYVAQSLKAYVQVHNVWIRQVSYHNNPMPPTNTNVYIALISTPAGDEGGLDPVQLHVILVMSKFLPMTASLTKSDNYSGAHPARAEPSTFTLLKIALAISATNVNTPDTSLLHVLVPLMMLTIQLLPSNKQKRMLMAPVPLTMVHKHVLQSSSIFVATWNCATLNEPSRIAALQDSTTPLGKANIVFIQEMWLALPQQLPISNPFL